MSPGIAARGLSGTDVETIRAALDAGRKPKVEFTPAAGQIVGKFGQVVDLLDPAEDEWIVVRFGRDELPFSPADLAIPAKTPAKRAPKVSTPEPEPEPEPEPTYPTYEELAAPSRPARKAASRQEDTMSAPVNGTAVPAQAVGGDDKPRKVAKAAKPKPLPSLTVTVAYTDGDWTVAAQQGSKALARPYIIKAAEALQLVGMLDVPGVAEAVEQIIEGERAQAQAQAARLRTELAEIEARLADFPKVR
jgi:uncharacterized protein DUF6319